MDLREIVEWFSKAPLWLKADVVIVQLAALFTAVKVLRPGVEWLIRACRKLVEWADIEDRWNWVRHKPSVRLRAEPELCWQGTGGGSRQRVIATVDLDLLGNDLSVTNVSLEDMQMWIWHGRGKRRARIKLTNLAVNYGDKNVSMVKERLVRSVTLEGWYNKAIPESYVDLDRAFKWRIGGVRAQVFGAKSRALAGFGGTRGDLRIVRRGTD